MINKYKEWLIRQGKSINTIESYSAHIQEYLEWFKGSFDSDLKKLYRENVLDFISYLLNVKKLNVKSINAKTAALMKFNEFLIEDGVEQNIVVFKKDYIKIQVEYASPATINRSEVEAFRKKILEHETKRDYTTYIKTFFLLICS